MEIDPNDAESQVALGVASRGDGKFDQARKAYERALDIEPDYPPALYDLGVLYMDFDKDPAKATAYLTQFLDGADADDPRQKDAIQRLKDLESQAKAERAKAEKSKAPKPAAKESPAAGAKAK